MKRAASSNSDYLSYRQDSSASTLPENRLFRRRSDWQSTEDLESLSRTPQCRKSKPGKVLEAVRSRGLKSALQITPEIAAKAVKDFLLPMFEKDGRMHASKVRDATFSLRGSPIPGKLTPLEAVPGTVYGELKLSEQLNAEMASMRAELNSYKQRFREATQARESALSEFLILQQQITKAKTDFQLLMFQDQISKQNQQQLEQRFAMVTNQLGEYMQLYTHCETEKKQLSSLLHEERASCDKLRNKATELEHGNSLLKMENDIIGERLKGLYEAIMHISDREMLEEKLGGEMQCIMRACQLLTDLDEDLIKRTSASLHERDQIRDDYQEMSRLRKEAKDERDRIALAAKDQIFVLQANFEKMREELENTRLDASKLEMQFQDLAEEHEKLRQKMKLNRLKRRQYGEAEEKICKKCQRIFLDSENYNWSCRTHKSEFGEEMWWCCGKTSRDAAGCIVSMHQSKDDEEESDLKSKEENEKMAIAGMRCSVKSK